MSKKNEAFDLFIFVVGTLFILVALCLVVILETGVFCKVQGLFSQDKYCYYHKTSMSNITYDGEMNKGYWELRSHKQDKEEERQIAEHIAELQEEVRLLELCYDSGEDYNLTFDIKEDYGYNCQKIDYINDHLIDKTRQVDGGYIEGSSFGVYAGLGFGSVSGYTKGELHQYVTEKVTATGQLVQGLTYHLDCNQEKSGEIIDYYTESEFVIYYVDNCIT